MLGKHCAQSRQTTIRTVHSTQHGQPGDTSAQLRGHWQQPLHSGSRGSEGEGSHSGTPATTSLSAAVHLVFDVVDDDRGGPQVVHWHVKEPMQLLVVQVHCQHVGDACRETHTHCAAALSPHDAGWCSPALANIVAISLATMQPRFCIRLCFEYGM